MRVDQISDFNEVVSYYRRMLMLSKALKPDINATGLARLNKDSIGSELSAFSYFRVLANNISLYIGQIHEKTGELDEDKLIDLAFNDIDSIKNIHGVKGDIDLAEMKKQIRNCLAHAEYYLDFDGVKQISKPHIVGVTADNINVVIDNGKIQGTISFEDMRKFAENYLKAYASVLTEDTYSRSITTDIDTITTPEEYLDRTVKYRFIPRKDKSGMKIEDLYMRLIDIRKPKTPEEYLDTFNFVINLAETYKAESFDLKEETLPSKAKELFKKFVAFVGFDTFKDDESANISLNKILPSEAADTVALDLLTELPETLRQIIIREETIKSEQDMNKRENDFNDLIDTDYYSKYRYQGPMLFAYNLLGLAHYCFSYARGVNENNDKDIFDYFDIENLDGIKARYVSPDGTETPAPICELINPKIKATNRLDNAIGELRGLEKKKKKYAKLQKEFSKPENRHPEKELRLAQANSFLDEYEDKKKELEKQERQAKVELSKADDTIRKDSSEFFRHLRNSLSHGRYTIDFGDFKDLRNIVITFTDIDDKKESEPAYVFDLTARELVRLVEGLQNNINRAKTYIIPKKIENDLLKIATGKLHIDDKDIEESQTIEDALKGQEKSGEKPISIWAKEFFDDDPRI